MSLNKLYQLEVKTETGTKVVNLKLPGQTIFLERDSFPENGDPLSLYVATDEGRFYIWDDAEVVYKAVGFSQSDLDVADDDIVTLSLGTNASGVTVITASHANSGATAGNYGQRETQTIPPTVITIPAIDVDVKGHITGIADHTVAITSYSVVTSTSDGLAPKLEGSNNAFLAKPNGKATPEWITIFTIDGGSATTTNWGEISED